MNLPRSILVITSNIALSETQLATSKAMAQAVAEKIGAEVLMLGTGQHAYLIGTERTEFKATSDSRLMTATQGETMSFMLDPLEQAIDQAARLLPETTGELAVRLSRHLDTLLAEQLKRVTAHE
ncbi:hypothetical protein G7009_01450 [Pseudomonas capeferrum]|uniref:hypothetical protein n=1 Tax=Pseudomonas capeferrum TaxID=1495066 RepID=UPI0015E2F5A0|nr:hypothetical protein [Pseudomonas capeferrum]MBA1200468.1 hypothetical protein [Pseudomonas capeferrum]